MPTLEKFPTYNDEQNKGNTLIKISNSEINPFTF